MHWSIVYDLLVQNGGQIGIFDFPVGHDCGCDAIEVLVVVVTVPAVRKAFVSFLFLACIRRA